MNKPNILIIGANGQLGRDMVKTAQTAGYNCTAIDYPQLDITNQDSVEKVFSLADSQIVINCAAFTAVDDCEKMPDTAYKVNATGPGNLASASEKTGARLIHISTDYVFDGSKNEPYVESDQTGPRTVYGSSKLEGEIQVKNKCSRYQIYRIAWLYGLYGNNFVRAIRKGAAAKKATGEPLRVVNDQWGTPTSTRQVCNQIFNVMELDINGIFHCTCEGKCTWYDFASEIVKTSGIDVKVIPCTTQEYVRPAPRPAYSVLENARLKELGLNIMPDWKNAFYDFLKEESEEQSL
jgi:dTDP-4-dehydrorhamnose reductase